MDKLKTGDKGGFPLVLDDIRWMTGQLDAPSFGIIPAINSVLAGHGSDFIVTGCVVTGSNPTKSMTAGWVMLGGELLYVDAIVSTLDTDTFDSFVKSSSFDTRGDKDFQSTVSVQTYETNRATITALAGTLTVTGDTLWRWREKVIDNTDIKGQNGETIENSTSVPDTSKMIRYQVTGKICHLNFNFQALHSFTASLPGVYIKLPTGIICANELESGTGNYRNSDKLSPNPIPAFDQTVIIHGMTLITTHTNSVFSVSGDAILVRPHSYGLSNFDGAGIGSDNVVNMTGHITFEIV